MADTILAESDIDEGGAEADTKRLRAVHDRMMTRADEIMPPQIPDRAKSLRDRRFVTIEGAQWEDEWAEQFENVPRPEVDKITERLEKIETDYRENRLSVDFIPGDDATDDDAANLLDGMYRADMAHFKSQEALDNAFQEGIRGGFGAWRLSTDYADPYDPDSDCQRVNPGIAIVDADQSVYFYGGNRYDASDAEAAFIISANLRSIAEDKWGPSAVDSWPLLKWRWIWEWYTPDVVYEAEYYEVEEVPDTVMIFTQKDSGDELRFFKSEIEDGVSADLKAQGYTVRNRAWKRRRVHKYIANGSRILKDCGYIAGPNIPIVPFYGRRDWVDNQARFRGHVRKQIDAQRILNSRLARMVEIAGISPFERPVFDPSQIDATQADQWARANIDRLPYLTAHALRNAAGDVVSAGPSFTTKAPDVPQVEAALLQYTSSLFDDAGDNVDQVKANTSADAMDIAAARVDAKSGIYLDNFRQSLARSGEIYEGQACEVNYEPGRKVETLTIDGQRDSATLQEPAVKNGVYKLRNDLTRGKFKVIASVQEATATKRAKATKVSLEIASQFLQAQSPKDALAALYDAATNIDGIDDDLKDYYRQQAIAVGSKKPTPEEAQEIQQAAAQQGQQPDPQAIALQASVQESQSKIALNQASAEQKQADAGLKSAQAEALAKAPSVPTGLTAEPANDPVEQVSKLASARLNVAKANHLEHDAAHKTIATGAQLAQQQHEREMSIRQQDLAERQAQGSTAE